MIQLVFMNGQIAFTEFIAKVPHCREEHRDPQLVTPNMRQLLFDFRHPDGVFTVVEIIKRG